MQKSVLHKLNMAIILTIYTILPSLLFVFYKKFFKFVFAQTTCQTTLIGAWFAGKSGALRYRVPAKLDSEWEWCGE
jgi:hypothetical protein